MVLICFDGTTLNPLENHCEGAGKLYGYYTPWGVKSPCGDIYGYYTPWGVRSLCGNVVPWYVLVVDIGCM